MTQSNPALNRGQIAAILLGVSAYVRAVETGIDEAAQAAYDGLTFVLRNARYEGTPPLSAVTPAEARRLINETLFNKISGRSWPGTAVLAGHVVDALVEAGFRFERESEPAAAPAPHPADELLRDAADVLGRLPNHHDEMAVYCTVRGATLDKDVIVRLAQGFLGEQSLHQLPPGALRLYDRLSCYVEALDQQPLAA